MGKLLFILLQIFIIPTLAFASPTTATTEYLRFTAGYAKAYYKKWNLSLLEIAFKVPKKKSLFKAAVGGSKSKNKQIQVAYGDVNAELLHGFVDADLPDEYTVEKINKNKAWVVQLAYEYYLPLWHKQWWKINSELYWSIGVMGQYSLETTSSTYKFDIEFDNDGGKINDKISLPGGVYNSSFDFYVPTCFNFDVGILTVKICSGLNVEKPKHSIVYGSFGFGY